VQFIKAILSVILYPLTKLGKLLHGVLWMGANPGKGLPPSWREEERAGATIEDAAQKILEAEQAAAGGLALTEALIRLCEAISRGKPTPLKDYPAELHQLAGKLLPGEANILLHSDPEDLMAFLEDGKSIPGVGLRADGTRVVSRITPERMTGARRHKTDDSRLEADDSYAPEQGMRFAC
jgi:hypothetical protein